MSLTKQTVLDQIETKADGHVNVRFRKEIVEDGKVLSYESHRLSVAPGQVPSNVVAMNDTFLVANGWPRISKEDAENIEVHVNLAITPEKVKAYLERLVAEAARA